MMKIAFGSDHAAFDLKEGVLAFARKAGHEVVDFGCTSHDPCDHSDFSIPVAEAVARGEFDGAVLACGSGQGMTIGANKVAGIRATLCLTPEAARLARAHNDSNVLVMAGRSLTPAEGAAIFEAWVSATFEGGRHARRMQKIADYERLRCGKR